MTAPRDEDDDRPAPLHAQMVTGAHLREGFDALARLLSAALVFGLPAWWLSEVLDQRWILPVGLVLGMAAAIALFVVGYGVQGPRAGGAAPGGRGRPAGRRHAPTRTARDGG